jgi:DNA-directed RNA polymerase II subunit RPB3
MFGGTCSISPTAKEEWPPTANAQYEREPDPEEPFDYNAKPGTFYLEAEGTGAMAVKDAVLEVRIALDCYFPFQ